MKMPITGSETNILRSFSLLIILIISFHTAAYCQVINGTIIDKKDKSKICCAAIYFNGTFVGTSSDMNGDFKLDVSKSASMPLTISCIGYYSQTMTDFTTVNPLIVYLEPKAVEMNEIVVTAKSLTRKRKVNLRLFKNEFIGTTNIARSCEILNEKDITFNYDSDRDTLKAFASKPILIYNKALGYKISYYLDKFEYCKKDASFYYTGNIIFNEDLTTNETNRDLYDAKRKLTYLGSRMHFFRALWANDLVASGFSIRNSDSKKLKYDSIVINENQDQLNIPVTYNKFITSPTTLIISYEKYFSNIEFLKTQVYFDATGYYDYSGICWIGEMMTKRIGDTLPYEYQPKKYKR